MCGIVGALALKPGAAPPSGSMVRGMSNTLVHRGPDDAGVFAEGPVAMAMRRLSIIDISGGKQPLASVDGSVVVVFNGEIYNFRELRDDLVRRGHQFRTQTDTEVLVHGYEEFGAAISERLNGMFAYSIYDRLRQRVSIVRDHLGVKPLYYAQSGGHLLWGSEPKALLATGLLERTLDLDALEQFLCWEYVPAPQTLFREIRKLEPGCRLDVDLRAGKVRLDRYWDVPFASRKPERSDEEWIERLDHAMSSAVRRQMVSDVPIGAFLSGGVDSSLIVAKMGPAKTFSIGFEDSTYDELPFADRVARHLNADHRTERIDPNVVSHFDHLMQFMDDPIGDFSIFPTFLVSKLAREDVKVVLSGDGGDEVFGGYDTFVAQRWSKLYGLMPAALRQKVFEPLAGLLPSSSAKKGVRNKIKRFVEGASADPALAHARWRLFSNAAMNSQLFRSPAAPGESPTRHIERLFDQAASRSELERSLYVDVKSYLSDNILTKVDRMSMAVSLEARVPMLDLDLVTLAFSLPDRLRVSGGRTKVALKQLAARYVPKDCVYRPKEGFSMPVKNWLSGQFRPLMDELLDSRRLDEGGLFRSDTIERLKREHLAGLANNSHLLWSLMIFEAWRERWLESSQIDQSLAKEAAIAR